jgi:N-methylhydantoinase A
MVAFGGSGPVHALAIAAKLKIPRVVFPIGAGVMSALGLLISPLSFELARSNRLFVEDLDARSFAAQFEPVVAEATGFLDRAGVPASEVTVVRRLDMRYQGQGYEIEVTLPEGGLVDCFPRLDELFRAKYAEVFSETFLEEPLEIVNWKVEAVGPEATLTEGYGIVGASAAEGGDIDAAQKGVRQAFFGDGYVDCAVYDRYRLPVGAEIEGPAMVEERESTCVIGPGDRAVVDRHLNLVAELEE